MVPSQAGRAPRRFSGEPARIVHFESVNGGKPDVNVKISGVAFGEALKFVEQLEQLLSPNSGFFIELIKDGVQAGYRFAASTLPSSAEEGVSCQPRFFGRDPIHFQDRDTAADSKVAMSV